MRKLISAAFFVALLSFTPARAADFLPQLSLSSAEKPIYTRSGFYVGAGLGGAGLSDRAQYGSPVFFTDHGSGGRFAANAFAGYDVWYGQWRVSPEVAFGTGGQSEFWNASGSSGRGIVTMPWHADATLGLGYRFGNLTPFVKAGLSVAHFKLQQGPTFAAMDTNSATRGGWLVGGGVDYDLTQKWSVRLDGLYADYGTSRQRLPTYAVGTKDRLSAYGATIGLKYRF